MILNKKKIKRKIERKWRERKANEGAKEMNELKKKERRRMKNW